MENAIHIGNNIRIIRRLKGMKQEILAEKLNITQQSVSKMEKKMSIQDKKIQQLSEIFNMTMDNIKSFDEEKAIQNNFALRDNVINPVKEIIEHFKGEVAKRDEEVERLKKELESYKNGGQFPSTIETKLTKAK